MRLCKLFIADSFFPKSNAAVQFSRMSRGLNDHSIKHTNPDAISAIGNDIYGVNIFCGLMMLSDSRPSALYFRKQQVHGSIDSIVILKTHSFIYT